MKGYGLVAAAALVWGLWVLFLRPAGLDGPTSALVALAAMSLPAPFVVRRAAFRDRGAVAALAVVGLADSLNATLYFAALEKGPVAVATLTHYLAPLLVALAAPWVLRERRSLRALAAVPVILGGLWCVVGAQSKGFSLTTAALGGGSALFYAAAVFGSKRAGRTFTPLEVTALHAPVSVAVLLALFGRAALPEALTPGVWRVFAGGLLCGLGASVVFNMGLRRITSQSAGTLTYLEPLAATAVGVLVFGEQLGPLAWLGAAVVVAAGAFVALERRPEPST